MHFLLTGHTVRHYVEAQYELQVVVTAGSVGLLAQGLSTIAPPIMITTGNGTLLVANGLQPMLRMRQNEKILTEAGVPKPAQAVTIAEPPYESEEDAQPPTVEYSTVTLDYSLFGSFHSFESARGRQYAATYQDSYAARSADLERYINEVTYLPVERGRYYNVGGSTVFLSPEQAAVQVPDQYAAVRESLINDANRLRRVRIQGYGWYNGAQYQGTGMLSFSRDNVPVNGGFRNYWDNLIVNLSLGNLPWPGVAEEETTYSGRYQAFMRYIDKDGLPSDPSPISSDVVLEDAPYILYRNLEVPTDQRVARRQIFRNRNGNSDVFYLDIDTEDLTSTSLISYNTDAQLQLLFGHNAFDENGNSLFYLYGLPPTDKPYICEFNSRVFAVGFRTYREGNVAVENGSTTIQGLGTNWHESFVGRKIIVSTFEYIVLGCDPATQEITIDRGYEGETEPYNSYVIQPFYGNSNLLQWSHPGFPESWPIENALTLAEDGDEPTGLVAFANSMWILKRRSIYQFNYTFDPSRDGDYRIASQRGCINQRCAIMVQGVALMLDRIGIHVFKGQLPRYEYSTNTTPDHLSKAIGDLFRFETSGLRLNWDSNTDFWHSSHNQELCTVRWYVAMNGFYLPHHAICYDYMMDRWWVEAYPFPISASSNTFALQGRPVLGGRIGKVYQPDSGPLDLVVPNGVTRLGVSEVHSNVALTLDDTPPDCEGTTIAIVGGTGRGQWRDIVAQDGAEIQVDTPWTIRPDDTSVIQIGGIPYSLRTGSYDYPKIENSMTHAFSVGFNHSSEPLETYVSIENDGDLLREVAADATWGAVSSKRDDKYVYRVDLANRADEGHINMDKMREVDIPQVYSMAAIMEGFSGDEKPVFTDITVLGAAGSGR